MGLNTNQGFTQDILAARSMTTISNVFLVRLQQPHLGALQPRRRRLYGLPRRLPEQPARLLRHRELQLQSLALALVLGLQLTPKPKQHWQS